MPKNGWSTTRKRSEEERFFNRGRASVQQKAFDSLCKCRKAGCVMCRPVIGRRKVAA